MTTQSYKRKHIMGTYSFRGLDNDYHGREYGGREAGRGKEQESGPGDTPPPTRPHLPILPNSSANWGPSFQRCEAVGTILVRPPHSRSWYQLLSWFLFFPVMRQCDQSNCHGRKHLTGACLQFQRVNLLSW